ncbi:hypothetical protein HYH03_003361 [Edaphochlamys debaryana]|uniref:Uncharacterized protein n=1 Tax=Edaphochlamys debaryana TaxID=47281 RepID=A0A836C4B9_9CHLO|nr:hypothetical protein HYH03_003361 [Edaphochlamys debaryana]|eukprot:KAG2498612.1 hypothetical protein HYH03_003361 [Edaphochlamys debaryana]
MAAAGAWPDDDGETANWSRAALERHASPYFVELELLEEPHLSEGWKCVVCAAKDREHVLAEVHFRGFGLAKPPIPGLQKGAVLRWRNAHCFVYGGTYISWIKPEDLPNIRLVRYAGAGANGDGARGPVGPTGPDGREVWWQEVLEASPRALPGAYIDVLVQKDPVRHYSEWRCEVWAKATEDAPPGEGLVGQLSFPAPRGTPRQPLLYELRKGAVLRWRNPRCLGRLPVSGFISAPFAAKDMKNLRVLEQAPFPVEGGDPLGSPPPPVPQQATQGAGSRPAPAGPSRARPKAAKARGQAREQEPREPMSGWEWGINICMGLLMVALPVFIYNSRDVTTHGIM